MDALDRRSFLRGAAGVAGAVSVSGLLAACTETDPAGILMPRSKSLSQAALGAGGYGDLVDAGLLLLPEGFRVTSFGVVNDPLSDGGVTPIAHDGMAAFPWRRDRVRLVRNHEDRNAPGEALISNVRPYDPLAGGGTVTLELDIDSERRDHKDHENDRRHGNGNKNGDEVRGHGDVRHPNIRVVKSWVSLSGTIVNCAGGATPWNSWLTCEEAVSGVSEGFSKTHGWAFDVPASAEYPVEPVPIIAMGRFSHEAVAMDFRTGIVYETEDNGFPPGSGFYRFLPRRDRELARGGKLQMARIKGQDKLEIWRGASVGVNVGDSFDVDWVDIKHVNPDPNDQMTEDDRMAAVFMQGFEQGAVIFNRLEGCWYGDNSIYFHDTRGGAVQRGHVWRYIPGRHNDQRDGGKLVLMFESPGVDVLDSPDNITVSPRGGLVLCEDGGGTQFLRGLTRSGQIFTFAQNNLNNAEFAGACFSPDGQVLFVNLQGATSGTPAAAAADPANRGMSLAITGPWRRGAL
jgi:uncharacterized protein